MEQLSIAAKKQLITRTTNNNNNNNEISSNNTTHMRDVEEDSSSSDELFGYEDEMYHSDDGDDMFEFDQNNNIPGATTTTTASAASTISIGSSSSVSGPPTAFIGTKRSPTVSSNTNNNNNLSPLLSPARAGGNWTEGRVLLSPSPTPPQTLNSSGNNIFDTPISGISTNGEFDSNSMSSRPKSTHGKLFTGTISRGGVASAKNFVNPAFYSSSVMVPVDKSSKFSLTIVSTETVYSNQKGYTVYVIKVKSDENVWTVVRRYKHVRAFSQKIQLEVPSLATYEFPSKKLLGNMNPSFVKQRKEQLQSFFNAISESPKAKQSRNLKVFLDPNFSPSLKTITNPSIEGYMYLWSQSGGKLSTLSKKKNWKKVYCVIINSNLFFWKNREQVYATAKGVILLRACESSIVTKHDKKCIEIQVLTATSTRNSNTGSGPKKVENILRPNHNNNNSNNNEDEDDDSKFFIYSESESKQNQWLDVIQKESLNLKNMNHSEDKQQSTSSTSTNISNKNQSQPPPPPISRSPTDYNNNNTHNHRVPPKVPKRNFQVGMMEDHTYRVCINDKEWLVDDITKNEKGGIDKDCLDLLEATLTLKDCINIDDTQTNTNSTSNTFTNHSLQQAAHQQFIQATIPSSSASSGSNTTPILSLSRSNTQSTLQKPQSSSSSSLRPNEIQLLPFEIVTYHSESIIHVHNNSGTIGSITVTNFRLYFIPYVQASTKNAKRRCESEPISIPLTLINNIVKCTGQTPDKLKYYAFEVRCKDFQAVKFMHLPGASQQKANSRLYEIFESLVFCNDYSNLFCFALKESVPVGWDIYKPLEEFNRMFVPNESWRISNFNNDYYYSPTYPKILVVPKKITDQDLIQVSSFRSKGRIPVLVWKHPREYSVLVRCSQPVIGVTGKRCVEDEKLVESIRLANLLSEKVYIMDARPQINAVANQMMGMGYESTNKNTYSNCILKFLGIENIHKMRESQKKLFKAITREQYDMNDQPQSSQQQYEQTQGHDHINSNGNPEEKDKLGKATDIWLGHIRSILYGVIDIVDIIRYYKSSVIVHCSDGWDRTSQLCALAELILDGYYRTIDGFQILIEKEWLSFGHKFESRIGHVKGDRAIRTSEQSPVFLQFMDCVAQMMMQYPRIFEFNQKYLLEIMHHLYSCRYGTFLYDNMRERETEKLQERSNSLWGHINQYTSQWRNQDYQPTDDVTQFVIDTSNLKLWKEYYLQWRYFHNSPL